MEPDNHLLDLDCAKTLSVNQNSSTEEPSNIVKLPKRSQRKNKDCLNSDQSKRHKKNEIVTNLEKTMNNNLSFLTIQQKLQFMDSLQISVFQNLFGPGKSFRKNIEEIKFSNDEKFAFKCKDYVGEH